MLIRNTTIRDFGFYEITQRADRLKAFRVFKERLGICSSTFELAAFEGNRIIGGGCGLYLRVLPPQLVVRNCEFRDCAETSSILRHIGPSFEEALESLLRFLAARVNV